MSKRKIAECLNVRINVGNYQHIELTKYAEEEIEYTSTEDRKAKEDALRDDLVNSLIRSMKEIPERLGKGIESAQEVEEAIQKAIPEWLANSPVPNIANKAEKDFIQNTAAQKDNKDENSDNLAEITDGPMEEVTGDLQIPTNDVKDEAEEDLFETDPMPVSERLEGADEPKEPKEAEESKAEKPVEEEEEEKEEEAKPDKKDELGGFFDDEDDDLFGD